MAKRVVRLSRAERARAEYKSLARRLWEVEEWIRAEPSAVEWEVEKFLLLVHMKRALAKMATA